MDNFTLFMIIIISFIVVCILIAVFDRADEKIRVKSSAAVNNYDYIKYFKEDRNRIESVEYYLRTKQKDYYKLRIIYISPAGRKTSRKDIKISLADIDVIKSNPKLVMTSAEYNQILREQKQIEKAQEKAIKEKEKAEKEAEREEARRKKEEERVEARRKKEEERVEIQREKYAEKIQLMREKEAIKKAYKDEQAAMLKEKQQQYCDRINEVIDYANTYKDTLIIKTDKLELDNLISKLYDKAYNVIKKVKNPDSGEFEMLDISISNCFSEAKKIVQRNQQILDYYDSDEFKHIKETCDSLMNSQREFNEYIEEKAESIATLFGSRVVRNETENIYQQNYIRPYKKTVTPFTVEVSKAVFSSAENDPMEYIVKKFYTNKSDYPEQIQKLQLLIGELETLKDAKEIIDNYKKDYRQFITTVPEYIMENDEDGFYYRLGFANISERALTIEYRFSYTSDGGMVQKSFPVPMTEETIISLIDTLESKLSMEAFTKEQRALMTKKLRQDILQRDNFTCQNCGNSTYTEPNLLLEIDHITPVSKGGLTEENNLQTLCWKCNRKKAANLFV